jgi:hypothetical protein
MSSLLRVVIAATCGVAVAFSVFIWLSARHAGRSRGDRSPPGPSESAPDPDRLADRLEIFPDPNAQGTAQRVFVDPNRFDQDLFTVADLYTRPVRDERSLRERGEVIAERAERGLAELMARHEQLALGTPPTRAEALEAIGLWRSIAFLHLYEGRLDEGRSWLLRALELAQWPGVPAEERDTLRALLGIVALRRGEQENCIACVGPSSCIFPIAGAAVHQQDAGSREAVEHFTAYLADQPGDLRVRWLLNIAYMTLGEYPDGVPPQYLIPIDRFRSTRDIGRFTNVATLVGLTSRGPAQAGGAVFDDFDGDNRPDILFTSVDVDRGTALYLNQGDGTFADHSSAAGLDEQIYALNVRAADFDNDGRLDVVLLRGGWEQPARLSLLRNTGGGAFEDVTEAAGLDEPIATEAAAWGDYDNDGLLDLFVCGEYRPSSSASVRNLCRLYRNQGDGTFRDIAAEAGVQNDRYAKGCAWADFDNDGLLDLFVSNMGAGAHMPSRLYHNQGDGTFRDIAAEMGLGDPNEHFTCVAFDYDDDGWTDLLVSDYKDSPAHVVAADFLGLPVASAKHPFLYRNLEGRGFADVSREAGLGRPIAAMSLNVGDLDNDGRLDLHFGTGWMSFMGLIPELTFLNVEGRRFEDITESSGTGHLQKGHGVSFADWDADGDLDLFFVPAGGYPGDRGYHVLFQNPGHGRHWLKLKLVGTKTNRSALGAKVEVTFRTADGAERIVRRTIGGNGSFGGNSLVEHIGLLDAERAERVTIAWPTSHSTQTFEDVAADRLLEITEGADAYTVIPQAPLPSPRF